MRGDCGSNVGEGAVAAWELLVRFGNLVDEGVFGDGAAVHLPEGGAAVVDVLPEDIGFAVAVEVADLGAPTGFGDLVDDRISFNFAAIHEPEGGEVGAAVVPEEVGFAVAVEVADLGVPVGFGDLKDDRIVKSGMAFSAPGSN